MSGAALGWAKSRTAPNATAKAVLVCLADYADESGSAWPAIPRLAKEVQASVRTVQRALRGLEECGLLTTEKRDRKDGGQTSNGYRLAMTPGDNVTPAPVTECHPPGDASVIPPVTPVSPPYEPPLEQKASDEALSRPRKRRTVAISPMAEVIWAAAPRKARERSSKIEVDEQLRLAEGRGHDAEEIAAALDAAYRSDTYAGDRAKGVHRLIEKDRWMSFSGSVDVVPAPSAIFDGPAALRAALVDEKGEEFTERWLDHYCRWDAGSRSLIARSPVVAKTLTRELTAWLAKHSVCISTEPTPIDDAAA